MKTELFVNHLVAVIMCPIQKREKTSFVIIIIITKIEDVEFDQDDGIIIIYYNSTCFTWAVLFRLFLHNNKLGICLHHSRKRYVVISRRSARLQMMF